MTDQVTHDESPASRAADAEPPAPAPAVRRSLTRQTAAIFAGGLVAQASAVLLLSGLTRLVSQDQLGAYQQLTLLYGIVSPLLVAGIPTALLYFIPRSHERAEIRSWVGTAYVVLGTLGVLFSITTAVAREPIAAALGNPQLAPVLLVYAPFPGLAFVASVLSPALVGLGRAALATMVGVTGSILSVICVLSSRRGAAGRRVHRGGPGCRPDLFYGPLSAHCCSRDRRGVSVAQHPEPRPRTARSSASRWHSPASPE